MLHSYLYVPGDRPELMVKAATGPAHALIIDLEDGVAPRARDDARPAVRHFLTGPARNQPTAVRVDPNSLDKDLRVAVDGRADLVYLPKAEAGSVSDCDAILDVLERERGSAPVPVVALIETAAGLLDVATIARSERIVGLALGESDLCAELGVDPELDEAQRHMFRLPLVVASAAAGVRGPTAPASTNYTDLDQFRASCIGLRRLGFAARSAIHPAQVPIINDGFAPDPAAVAAARALVTTFDAAVDDGSGIIIGEDGRMVDAAVVRSARRLLD